MKAETTLIDRDSIQVTIRLTATLGEWKNIQNALTRHFRTREEYDLRQSTPPAMDYVMYEVAWTIAESLKQIIV